jgi:predicted nucleic acid-binding protein
VAAFFLDSSALVKRYVPEAGSEWVTSLTKPATRHGVYVARISLVEIISALARRARSADISTSDVAAAQAQLGLDFAKRYRVVEMTADIVGNAANVASRHALRAYDAVQLAAAVTIHARRSVRRLSPLTFVSSDQQLNEAASAEGLLVDDPNQHP